LSLAVSEQLIRITYHIQKNTSIPTTTAMIIDSRELFFWIPSINLLKVGTLAKNNAGV
jgi:hypothetical protein